MLTNSVLRINIGYVVLGNSDTMGKLVGGFDQSQIRPYITALNLVLQVLGAILGRVYLWRGLSSPLLLRG